MKKLVQLLVLLVLLIPHSWAGEREDILDLVFKWNDLHNTKETFQGLYAPTVLFYGKYKSRETCIRNKKGLSSKKDFHQAISSPVTVKFYASGIAKCTFLKETTIKKVTKSHDCYLLVKQENGQWYITGESDSVTDKNLHVQLDLGEELSNNNTGISQTANNKTAFIVGGLALIFASWFLSYTKKQRRQKQKSFVPRFPMNHSHQFMKTSYRDLPPQTEKIKTTVKREMLQEINTSLKLFPKVVTETEKGNRFEKYVVSRFARPYFILKEWRSDKYHEGVYAASNRLPDLQYHFKTSHHDLKFAVECKWRAEFFKGRIEWAKSYQIENYRKFEMENGIPVFVIIGVGGQPDNPDAVYIIPLKDIRSNVITSDQLVKYHRYKKGNFYLHADPLRIE